MNLSSNLIGNFNDGTNFLHKLLLTHTEVSKIRKAFSNGSSANRKFSKTQYSTMIKSGAIIDELLAGIPNTVIKGGTQILINKAPVLIKHATKYFVKTNR